MSSVVPIRPLELMQDENMTKSEFSDFIGVWDGFMPKSVCQKFIDLYEQVFREDSIIEIDPDMAYMDGEQQFAAGALGRSDSSLLLNYVNTELGYTCNQYLQACVQHYISKFPQLKTVGMFSSDIKMQKTPPGGGYHVWHYENSSYQCSQRELVWIIYLNDMPDGEAETEFLYQKRRIKPTAGTVVVWPAGMTHVHKGNTVFTQDKYILTGWYIKLPTV